MHVRRVVTPSKCWISRMHGIEENEIKCSAPATKGIQDTESHEGFTEICLQQRQMGTGKQDHLHTTSSIVLERRDQSRC